MLIWGGGALLGSKCMEIKVSYVQARRFIDFHTLILNSYDYIKKARNLPWKKILQRAVYLKT